MKEYPEPHLSIQQWADEDKPREKLLTKGVSALSDAELVAILLRSGTKNVSAVEMAKQLLADYKNNLNELARALPRDMTKRKGMGDAKGLSIIAALELGRRRQQQSATEKPVLNTSLLAYNYMAPVLADLPHEEFHVVYLNRANKILATERISIGGVSGTIADVRIILRMALQHMATCMILFHNHPSGNIKPSSADDTLTHKVKEAAKYMDIIVTDHIIIGQGAYYSYADEGKI